LQAKQATFQAPCPEVKIYDPKSDNAKMYFSTASKKVLREYSFKTSVDDVRGQFSLTFYPDEYDGSEPIFDQINILDIVEIYEAKNHFKQYHTVSIEGSKTGRKILPTFTGVVRSIKYASQTGGGSVTRRLVVSGHSVAGLVAEFYMNMDTSAQVLTDELAAQEAVAKSLTLSLLEGWPKNPLKLKEIIKKIWEAFVDLSKKHEKISNPEVYNILEKWAGDFFDIDENITFNYPLGCVFNAKTTQGFFDIVESIIPYQVYEKFAYMDRPTGKMRIKIRECPFDKDKWHEIGYGEIPIKLVKALNIEQNDKEVYTVFFSYLNGYPVEDQKSLILAKQNQYSKKSPLLVQYDKKYSKYGYRPLFVHFIGYSKVEGKDDTSTAEKLVALNQRLKDWYGDMESMYHGQITMSTDLSMDMPQAGEKISFIGGEFYVSAAEHRWAYKGNPETVLTISRGGVYSEEETEIQKEILVDNSEPAQSYTVNEGDQIKKIALQFYGTESKFNLIINANPFLKGRPISGEGLPTIYKADILIIPPDKKNETVTEKVRKIKFHELKYWRHKKTGGGIEWRI
jgi:hypothetical protein